VIILALPDTRAAISADGRVCVAICGDLDITTEAELARQLAGLASEISAVAGARLAGLVINLAGVTFLDCASARMLAATATMLASGDQPVLIAASPAVRRVLQLTGLAAIFEIRD
jgi:anti-anti-sigma factor